jgi:hypothetical protein
MLLICASYLILESVSLFCGKHTFSVKNSKIRCMTRVWLTNLHFLHRLFLLCCFHSTIFLCNLSIRLWIDTTSNQLRVKQTFIQKTVRFCKIKFPFPFTRLLKKKKAIFCFPNVSLIWTFLIHHSGKKNKFSKSSNWKHQEWMSA